MHILFEMSTFVSPYLIPALVVLNQNYSIQYLNHYLQFFYEIVILDSSISDIIVIKLFCITEHIFKCIIAHWLLTQGICIKKCHLIHVVSE